MLLVINYCINCAAFLDVTYANIVRILREIESCGEKLKYHLEKSNLLVEF